MLLSACGGGGSGGGSGSGSTAAGPPVTPIQGFSVNDRTFSAGSVHSLAIKAATPAATGGTLYSWGSNLYGQLGIGSAVSSLVPTLVPSTPSWSQVSAGGLFSVALRSDGTLWTWGYNINYQLGQGLLSSAIINAPVKVTFTSVPKDISAGDSHVSVVLTDGSIWTWGRNADGQLGINSNSDASTAVQMGLLKTWESVSAGGSHTLAKQKTTNYLYAWGANANGQLGQLTNAASKVPVLVNLLSPTTVAVFSAGATHSMAITTDGNLWAWGGNGCGQIGDGTSPPTPPFSTPAVTTYDHNFPFEISTSGDWGRVAAGGYHSLALKKDGTLWAWGCNQYGQLGNGNTTDSNTPTQIGVDTNWLAISAGKYHSMAVKSDGSLWVWGRNDSGQLGNGSTTMLTVPTRIP